MRTRTLRRTGLVTLLGAAAALVAACNPVDTTTLPLGDKVTSTAPTVGKVWSCTTNFTGEDGRGGGGAGTDGPWIDNARKTWDKQAKPTVSGAVTWPSVFQVTATGSGTTLTGNGLPSTPTGVFPVQPTDPAYAYDRNPNSIKAVAIQASLPTPAVAPSASCVGGMIGYSVLGVPIFSAFDAEGRDAPAHEVEDACDGHPQKDGRYHFHALSRCYTAPSWADPGLFGYALDGFGIYVERDVTGDLPATSTLDACHGRTSTVTWHGQQVSMYHYVATEDFPYLVGCFRGTPVQQRP
jgi:hypothetical protein